MWVNPPIVATGDFVTATLWNTYVRANGLHLRGLVPDASSASDVLTASSSTAGVWQKLLTAHIQDFAITTAKLQDLSVTVDKIGNLAVTTGKIANATVTAAKLASDVAIVPAHLIAGFEHNSDIPAGWSRYTPMDGRLAVGAGSSFSVTFNEGNSYGSSWSHQHTGGAHTH